MFVCIQNPGVAPVEGFTLLGVSTTRDCGVEGTVGQFGSGNKHAINVLLRAGLKVFVYCGKTRLDFQTRDDEIDDGLVRKPVKRVVCKMGGTSTRTIDLGWVLDFGAIDWTDLGMALREFVSNAIDRTVREENGEFIPALQDGRRRHPGLRRERQGEGRLYRVYVEFEPQRAAVHRRVAQTLPGPRTGWSRPAESFLPKGDRNLNGTRTAVIDRAGASSARSKRPKMNRSTTTTSRRQSCRSTSAATPATTRSRRPSPSCYHKASAAEVVPVFKALVDQKPAFEAVLDSYYILPSWETPKEEQQKNWQQAWQAVASDAVLRAPWPRSPSLSSGRADIVRPVFASGFVDAAARFGIKTDVQVLTANEQKGREKLPATPAAEAARRRSVRAG